MRKMVANIVQNRNVSKDICVLDQRVSYICSMADLIRLFHQKDDLAAQRFERIILEKRDIPENREKDIVREILYTTYLCALTSHKIGN